ncbi:MAG: nitronate monooxygenase [Gammaproteobacteria bacterium]|nr:nitronate monooxygenase [Gammaproteobacteria bacterium]
MKQRIKTRFTEFFDVSHPIMLAPMDQVSDGHLAAAVSKAGGLGMIGGGYGNQEWLEQAFSQAAGESVGVGFITWSLMRQPELIDLCLDQKPAAFMVSFGDSEIVVAAAKRRNIPTIWQVQRLDMAKQALDAGADVIVVQGQEAGGHGMSRGLVSLLPAVRDLAGNDQIIVAAGGIFDGRGRAGALSLGADGVMLGTRLWASEEANGSDAAKALLVNAKGDDTLRSKVFDVARGVDWPWYFTGRVVGNQFSNQWHNNIGELQQQVEAEQQRYLSSGADDFDTRVLIAGECLDGIQSIKPAKTIIHTMVDEAVDTLNQTRNCIIN